jgi:hypothetical protein
MGIFQTISYDFRVADHPENCSAILTALTVRATMQQSLRTLGNLTPTNLQRTTILNTTPSISQLDAAPNLLLRIS